MRPIYLLFACCLCWQLAAAQSGAFSREMAQRLQHAAESTISIATLMPEEKYNYRPVNEEMTFEAQMKHMALNISRLANVYLLNGRNTLEDSIKAASGKEAVIAVVRRAFADAVAAVNKVPEPELEKQVDFFAGPLSKRQIMMLMNDHQTHHRGQLVVYLRLNNIKPPAYVGW